VTGSQIIDKAIAEGRILLTEVESKALLKQAGISVNDTRLATSKEEAINLSKQIGLPVVLKVASSDIVHKSDAGGVKLGLNSVEQVGAAYEEILQATRKQYPEAKIDGVAVQKMARPGVEVIIGMTKDDQFGPMLMFGLGGILVEIMKDVSFRLVPLNRLDAREMIQEIKGYPALEGHRGQEPSDISALEELLLKVSDFANRNPQVREIDLNPVFAYKNGAIAVDARVILENKAAQI